MADFVERTTRGVKWVFPVNVVIDGLGAKNWRLHKKIGRGFLPALGHLLEVPADDLKAGLVGEGGDCGLRCFPRLPAKDGGEGFGGGVDGDLALVHLVRSVDERNLPRPIESAKTKIKVFSFKLREKLRAFVSRWKSRSGSGRNRTADFVSTER